MIKLHNKVIFKPYSQDQEFLLPKNVNNFVDKGHIARLLSAIIDSMDIQNIIDTYKGGGTSSYNPKMLLKAWILGFIYRIHSCRLLAKAIRENLPFIWVAGNQQPDFRTLNEFRLRLKNEIKKVFKEIVRYALEQGIIEGKDIFVDHTKNEANANQHKMIWRKKVETQLNKIDEELDELFKHIDKINEEEEEIFGSKDLPEQERSGFDKDKVQEIVNKINERVKKEKMTKEKAREDKKTVRRTGLLIERKKNYEEKKKILNGRNSYSKTDNDAVAMMMKDKKTIRPAYNEGVAVENGIILDYVISDNGGDCVSFIPLMEGVEDNLGKTPKNTNSDGAYGNEENMSYLKKKRIKNFLKYSTYHQEKKKSWKDKNRFEGLSYDKKKDEFTCPSGIKLKFKKIQEEPSRTGYVRKTKIYVSDKGDCDKCNFHRNKTQALGVSWNYENLKKQAKLNLDSEKGIDLRRRRGYEVETIFGEKKLNKKKRRYHLRGLEKVNLEAGLYYIGHNIEKIHKKLSLFNEQILFSLKFALIRLNYI